MRRKFIKEMACVFACPYLYFSSGTENVGTSIKSDTDEFY
jgi:hypothetical protein